MTREAVLTKALERIAAGGNGSPFILARAALEAASKLPGLADDQALVGAIGRMCRDADWPVNQDEEEYIATSGGNILRAIDAYLRGAK